jgi:GcrA cell cycle regulator
MSQWTEERENRVRELWEQGYTASEIANDLACGLSRNAVIGKIHRLKLSRTGITKQAKRPLTFNVRGHVRWTDELDAKLREWAAAGMQGWQMRAALEKHLGASVPADACQSRCYRIGVPIKRGRPQFSPPARVVNGPIEAPQPEPIEGVVLPFVQPGPERVTLMDLRPGVCRWPIGDPIEPGFGFCGDSCDLAASYCPAHYRMAYVPSANRRTLDPEHRAALSRSATIRAAKGMNKWINRA